MDFKLNTLLHKSEASKGCGVKIQMNVGYMDIFGEKFIYLGFYVAFNTVQVISRRVVGRAEETST